MFHLVAGSGCKCKCRQICVPVQEAPVCLLEFPVRVRKMLVGVQGQGRFWLIVDEKMSVGLLKCQEWCLFLKSKGNQPKFFLPNCLWKEVVVLSTHLDYFLVWRPRIFYAVSHGKEDTLLENPKCYYGLVCITQRKDDC